MPHTKNKAVKGAWMLALSTAAIPKITKLITMTSVAKKVFKRVAVKNPKKAPINKLGANTPPSPPATNVADVINGFKRIMPINVSVEVMT